MPRFTSLYSGSTGNAYVLEENGHFLMIDMGASCRATVRALESIGLSPANLDGILITHEHSDHIKGLKVFLKHHPVPIYSGLATINALWYMDAVPEETELVAIDGRTEELAGFEVSGFSTSHDCAGCCGFRIRTQSGACMAIATDLGIVTDKVFDNLRDSSLVALEANYDPTMLRTGLYPAFLKRRITGIKGHLSNEESATTVAKLISFGCKKFALCHLSQENNMPFAVKDAITAGFFAHGITRTEEHLIQICRRHEVSPWIEF